MSGKSQVAPQPQAVGGAAGSPAKRVKSRAGDPLLAPPVPRSQPSAFAPPPPDALVPAGDQGGGEAPPPTAPDMSPRPETATAAAASPASKTRPSTVAASAGSFGKESRPTTAALAEDEDKTA